LRHAVSGLGRRAVRPDASLCVAADNKTEIEKA